MDTDDLNKLSELHKLEEEFECLSDADSKEPGKYALRLNALGEEISLLRTEFLGFQNAQKNRGKPRN